MSLTVIGCIGFGILILLFSIGMPIGFALALVGFLGFASIAGIGPAFGLLESIPYVTVTDYSIFVVPMFVVMGELAYRSGMVSDLYKLLEKWTGQIQGGLAIATIGGSAGFAAVCGLATPPAAMFTRVSWPEMKRHKYHPALALGCIAAGATLGILIPPSVPLVVYGLLTEQSVGKLLVAGVVPGLLLSGLFMLTIYIQCRFNPSLGPRAQGGTWKERLHALYKMWGVLFLFILSIGGIYGGIFTPTEGGAVGAVGAFSIALSKRQLSWQQLADALMSSLEVTTMIFIILIGAYLFTAFMAVSELPITLANGVKGSTMSPMAVLFIILFVYFLLGCFSDIISSFVLTLPIVYPILKALGFDPIWFGVVSTVMIEMGLLTPPIGLVVFVVAGTVKDVGLETIFRGVLPFVAAQIVCILLLVVFPQIALFLPNLMMK